jgi:hypothetical protein
MLISRLLSSQTPRLVVLALAGTLGAASSAGAQEFQDLKKPATPLVSQSQGSFTVGGDIVFSDALGPTFGDPYADEQFPVEAMDRFAKQMVPDLNADAS